MYEDKESVSIIVKCPWVLVNTEIGTMIVNRMDYDPKEDVCGVGTELLDHGVYQYKEAYNIICLLHARRQFYGDGVLMIDGGANIGAHTVALARSMDGWGNIIAVEAQERTFYSLAGNLNLNNIFNAQALYAALSDKDGGIDMPQLDQRKVTNFGGASCIGLEGAPKGEFSIPVRTIAIDSFELKRCDLIKLDIEGMELQAILGAKETIERCRPVLFVEHIHTSIDAIKEALPGYKVVPSGMNVMCIALDDRILEKVTIHEAA